MSLKPTSSSLADEQMAMALSSYVGHNVSHGRSIQVNGPLNFEKLQVFIGHLCSAPGHVAAPEIQQVEELSKTPARAQRVGSMTQQNPRGFSSQGSMEWIISRKKASKPVNSGKYVRLHNKHNGKETIVRVTFDAKAAQCFMDARIVRRLGFESPSDPAIWRSPNPSRLNGDYIDLICNRDPGNVCDKHRFYVDKNCRFDILIGSSSTYVS